MGGSNPVSKVLEKAERVVEAASFVVNPVTGVMKETSKAAGVKADAIFDPVGATAAQAAESYIDKPKEMKETQKRLTQEAARENEMQLKRLRDRKKQEGAEKAAAEDLQRGRARQARRRRSSGRQETLLTQSLGGAGGESNQGRKTLLGL